MKHIFSKSALILILLVGSIPLNSVHACLNESMETSSILENNDMPCHSEVNESSANNCQCLDCSCPDLCGNIVVYNLEINADLTTSPYISLPLLDQSITQIAQQLTAPLIRPPINP